MQQKVISELSNLATVDPNADYVPVVDVSDTTASDAGTTKKALVNQFIGDTGSAGADGDDAYVYIAYASDDSGTGFTTTFNASLNYIAIKTTDTEIVSPAVGDFTGLWKNYKGATGSTGSTGSAGADGDSAYVYIAYASDGSGTGFTMTFNSSLDYIAILTTDTEIVSPVVGDFAGLWKNYKGATGATGAQGDPGVDSDMVKATYDPQDIEDDAFDRANHTGEQAISTVTSLQTALDGKVDENAGITGATKTKVTYDAKGLVTAGADATTADIADSSNRRYVTDAESTVIDNTSGTNTGDQDLSGLVAKSTYDANSILQATSDNTPVALTVGEQTVIGRATGGAISALAIDSDLSSTSTSDDTVPSAKATKAALDAKQPLDADLTTLSTAFTTASASTAASLDLHEDTDNGSNKVTVIAPASVVTTDKVITLPDATDTLVGKATTDTLTNKTIDANGTGNALSNIEIADFAATAIVTAAEGLASSDNDTSVPTTAAVIDAIVGSGGGDMLAATYDPQEIEADAFDVDNHTDGTTNKVFTATEESKLSGIEASADVTDSTNVAAAGAVMEADYDAQSILQATSDNTPVALTVGEQTVVGRATGGNITALTIDSDLSSVSANHDTLPSAKGAKAYVDGGFRLLSVTTLAAGASGTFTKNAATRFLDVEAQAGGGGGGGADNNLAVASGGGGGAYLRKWITSPNSTYDYAVGASGGGGVGLNDGSTGGTTTFGTAFLSATGGAGGTQQTGGSTPSTDRGGAGGVATGGDLNIDGQRGGSSIRIDSTNGITGAGGNSFLGIGGSANTDNAGGIAATGYGGGGGGAYATSGTDRTGGAGAGGIIIIKEYI